MIYFYFPFFCVAIALAYFYGWHHGARWYKNTIERECNVTIDDTKELARIRKHLNAHPCSLCERAIHQSPDKGDTP